MNRKRIWELDMLRGIAIIIVILIHLTFDLVDLYRVWDLKNPWLYEFSRDWGGVIFLVISGICVNLGSRTVRRGITVFLCGMLCTAVTTGMYLLNFADRSIIIYFGVLHCLGCCMLLWPLFKKAPVWLLGVLGVILVAVGLYTRDHTYVSFPWLIPLGIPSRFFISSDYFPLMPNFGYFLLGAVIGKTVYAKKESLFPNVDPNTFILRFLCGCGKHSLLIYLLHQPILAGVIAAVIALL